MPIFVVNYAYSTDEAARDAIRPAHKAFLAELGRRGTNLCSGPFGPGEAPGALILLRADSAEHALRLTEPDPFRTRGVVVEVTAREWVPMLGALSAHF